MWGLFTDTSSWETNATKDWAISGDESVSLGVVFGGEAKVLTFTHQGLGQSKSMLMVSGSVGARLEASVDVGSLGKFLDWGGKATDAVSATNTNPTNVSPPIKVRVDEPFCLKDLEFANGVSGSVGTTAGVIETGVAMFTFYAKDGRHLFSMDDVTVQGALGAGINMGAIQGSRLINLRPTALPAAEQAANREFQRNLPWKYSPHNRGPGGGI